MNKISLDPYRHLEPFLRQKLFNDAWLQDFVTAESREKAQNIYKQFPYLPLQKNNNNHISIGKDVKSPAGFNQDPNIAPTEDQTCYLVQMPWTPPKQEDAKYAALSDSRAHFAKGIARLKRIEEALATETLGTTKEESEKEAAKRLSCVIGINRVYSLDINYNGEFRDFIASIPKMDRVALRILPFLWSPWQTRYISPVILNKFNGNAGWIYPIDKAYLLVKRLCSEKPWMIPALETYLHVKDHFHSLYRPKETLIPYQHIRDYVMHSAEMNRFLELFRRRAPKALTYVANLDSDFSALKTDEFGLYSHYDRIAQEHFAQHRKNASLMCTGYRAPHSVHWVIRYGIHLDMLARERESRIVGSSVYYIEPNFVFWVPDDKNLSFFSFKKQSNPSTNNTESRWFIENGIALGVVDPKHMVFSSQGAVETEIDSDWNRKNHANLPASVNLINQKVFPALRSVKQSHINSQIWATNLIKGLLLELKSNRTQGIAKLKAIHDIFSPIVWTTDLYRYTLAPAQSLRHVMDFFLHFLDCLEAARQHPEQKEQEAQRFLKQTRLTPPGEQMEGKRLFLQKLERLTQSLAELEKMGLTVAQRNTIVALAKATGEAVYEGLRDVNKTRVIELLKNAKGTLEKVRVVNWGNSKVLTKEEAHGIAAAGNLQGYTAVDGLHGKTIRRRRQA